MLPITICDYPETEASSAFEARDCGNAWALLGEAAKRGKEAVELDSMLLRKCSALCGLEERLSTSQSQLAG